MNYKPHEKSDEYSNCSFIKKDIRDYNMPSSYKEAIVYFQKMCQDYFKNTLKIFVVTGSCGREDVVEDWSDIDILLVVDGKTKNNLQRLASILASLTVKIGVTLYTPAEFQDCRLLDQKTLRNIQLLSSGTLKIQIIDENLVFPSMTELNERYKYATAVQLPSQIHTLRRLMLRVLQSTSVDVRQFTKELYNTVKIFLSTRGKVCDSYIDVRDSFRSFSKSKSNDRCIELPDIHTVLKAKMSAEELVDISSVTLDFIICKK